MSADVNVTSVSAAQKLEMWRDWFYPVFDISTNESQNVRFCAENRVWNIGGILLSRVVAPAANVTRGKLNISRAPVDHWVITYNRRGSTALFSKRGLLRAPAGVPFLWSMGDRTSSRRSSVDRVQLLIPRDLLRDIAPLLDSARGGAMNTPLGRLLGDYMIFLEGHLDSVSSDDMPRLTQAVYSMIEACVAPSGERIEAATREIELGRRERVRRVIDANLRSPALKLSMICKTVGISRSQLYRLFESAGGVLRYIQRQRLLRCHAILSDPESRQSIMSIAESFGFEDASGFSRAFRREFGYSPSEVKLAAEAGMPMSGLRTTSRTSEKQRFVDLLSAGAHVLPKSSAQWSAAR